MASRPAETCKVAGSSNNSNNSIINSNNNNNSNSNNYIITPIIFISMLKDQLAVLTAVRGLDYQGVRDPYQPREAGKTGPVAGLGPPCRCSAPGRYGVLVYGFPFCSAETCTDLAVGQPTFSPLCPSLSGGETPTAQSSLYIVLQLLSSTKGIALMSAMHVCSDPLSCIYMFHAGVASQASPQDSKKGPSPRTPKRTKP